MAEAPSAWVVLLTPIGVGLGYGCRRIAPIKILYNVSVDTFTAAVAAVVVGVAGSRHPIDVAGAVALAVAGLASGMITHVAVAGVIAVAQDTRLATAWRAGAGLQLLTAVGNVGAALVVGFPP